MQELAQIGIDISKPVIAAVCALAIAWIMSKFLD